MPHACLVPVWQQSKEAVIVPSTGIAGVESHPVGAGYQILSSARETNVSDY